jgi:hypothetical protein
MWFAALLRRRRTPRHPFRQRRPYLPRLERLEDRTLPSTLTVLNTLDSGAGSLRDAITSAKSGDTIVFAPSLDGQTITLTSDELAIKKSLDIEGPGAGLLAVSGNDTFRVFDVVNQGLTVTLAGLTISHGRGGGGGSGSGGGGGAILNASSTLNVVNDVLSNNQADTRGGGITNQNGVLTATNTAFIGNQAIGGAIASFNFSSQATLSVGGCTFTDNRAVGGTGNTGGQFTSQGGGGAIDNERGGTATVTGSAFTGNQAVGGAGAANAASADGLGGGLVNLFGATLTVSGCTLSGNQAIGGAGASGANGGNGFGGGIYNDGLSVAPQNAGTPATLTVTGSTLSSNQATGGAAGAGGSAGQGIGGGAYFADGGVVCLDLSTQANTKNNHASTRNDDLFGSFTTC